MGWIIYKFVINPLNAELNPICRLLALLGPHHILHVSRIRVKYIDLLLCCFQWISIQKGVLKYTLLHMRRPLSRYERSVRKTCGVRFMASPWTVGLSLRHSTQVACALSDADQVLAKCWDCRKSCDGCVGTHAPWNGW